MPVSVVKTDNDEMMWNQAKKYAADSRGYGPSEFDEEDWGLVMTIWKEIKRKYDGEKLPAKYESIDLRPLSESKSKKILVVDDEPDLLDVIKDLLDGYGFKNVDTAGSKDEALKKIAHGHYDIVVSDVSLPDPESGYEVAKAAKAKGCKVISFSGSHKDDFDTSLYDGHISKPIKHSELKVLENRDLEEAKKKKNRKRKKKKDDDWWPHFFPPFFGRGYGYRSWATFPPGQPILNQPPMSGTSSSPAYPGVGGINAPGVPGGANTGMGPIGASKEMSGTSLVEEIKKIEEMMNGLK